MYLETDLET